MPVKTDSPLLQIIEVNKSFDGLLAVAEVSFEVHPGEIVALIGPNGAGKTTLLNLVSGIYPPSKGSILLAGKSISGMKPHQIASMGIARTFQSGQIFQQMTVEENVLLGLHRCLRSGFLRGMLHLPAERREEQTARSRARDTLQELGLSHLGQQNAGAIRLKDQRCLEIARSVAAGPRLLLLDEPAAGLNFDETAEIACIIRRLRQRGVTILLVEHNMNLVMSVAERVIVLHHGVKIAEGTPAAIQRNPEVIRAYLGSTPCQSRS